MSRAGDRSTGRPAQQRGSVMIEALVSIVVTSLALLASAALAINAAKVNQTGRYRAQAVMLVNDIAERIDANVAAAAEGAYALAQTTAPSDAEEPTPGEDAGPDGETVSPADCSALACTPAQHAQADLAAWSSQAFALLPQASVQLAYTPAAGTTPGNYAITVTWVERSTGHGGRARTNSGEVNDSEPFAYTATKALSPR